MNFIWFVLFGFLTSLIAPILAIIPNFISQFLGLISKYLQIISYVGVFLAWFIGASTGTLLAHHYSSNVLTLIIYLLIFSFFQIRVWKYFIDEEKKNKAKYENFPLMSNLNHLIFYAILAPIVVFAFKPDFSKPLFSFIYDLLIVYLP